MIVTKIRKLISKLNKEDKLVGVWKKKRPELMAHLTKVRYRIDEDGERLVPTVEMKRKKVIRL